MTIAALSNALSGLKTSQRALGVISDNIANANTEGYVRKIAEPSSITLDGNGAGVEIGRIKRVVDEYLLRERREEVGELRAVEQLEIYFNEIQDLFGQPADNNSIASLTERLQTAFQNYEIAPEDSFRAEQVVTAAEDLASRLNEMHYTLQDLRARADNEIGDDITQLNTYLAQIDAFNVDIIRSEAKGGDAGGLRDKRDVALNRIAEIVDISYWENSDGAVNITTGGGKTLLDVDPVPVFHDTPNGLRSDIAFDPDRVVADPDLGTIRGVLVGGLDEQNDITTELRRGSVKGLVDLRDDILPALVAELDELSRELRDGINAIHNLGAAFPPPNALNGQREFRDYTASVTGSPLNGSQNAFNGTGVIRVSVLQANPPSERGQVVQSFTVDLDYLRGLDAGVDIGLTAAEPKLSASGSLTIEDVERAIDAQLNASGLVGQVAFSGGQFSITINDPDHGVVIDAPKNMVAPASPLAGVTGIDVAAGLRAGDSFQILGENAAQLGVVTVSDVNVDGVVSLADVARSINDPTTGVPGVTARVQGYPDPGVVGGSLFRLELTADDGQSIAITELTGTAATTLGLLNGATTNVRNDASGSDDALSGEPTVQFLESKGFANPEVSIGLIDQIETPSAAQDLNINVNGVAFSQSFDLTSTSLQDLVTAINGELFDNATARLAALPVSAAVTAAQTALVTGGSPVDVNAVIAAAIGAGATQPEIETIAEAIQPPVTARLVNVDGWKIALNGAAGADVTVSGDLATTLGFEEQEFGFSHYFGLNDFYAYSENLSASSDLQVRAAIEEDPNLLVRADMINSVTEPSDVTQFGAEADIAALTSGDNDGIKALAESMITARTFGAAGDLPEITLTFSEYATRILSNQSLKAALNGDDLIFREDVVGELGFRIDSISGVNIDEELSNLQLYQSAYTASARVISASQELLDELVNLVR